MLRRTRASQRAETVEQRIAALHARSKIAPAEEPGSNGAGSVTAFPVSGGTGEEVTGATGLDAYCAPWTCGQKTPGMPPIRQARLTLPPLNIMFPPNQPIYGA